MRVSLKRHLVACARALSAVILASCQSGTPETVPVPSLDPATIAARMALANERSLDVRSIPPRTIAIPPLSVRSADTTIALLGYGIADMLITDVARSSQVTVLERGRMDALLREMDLTRSGAVDSATAPRVGRLVGARQIVVGALIDRGNGELGIDTRFANTLDGSITTAVSARAPLAQLLDAEKTLVYRIFDELRITLTPAERMAIEDRPTASVAGFLAYSRGVRDEATGDYASAATNFRAAIRVDPGFDIARAHLTRVQSIPSATTTSTTTGAPNRSGAASLATSAINASPIAALGGGAVGAQEQANQQDRGAASPRPSSTVTVVINLKQLP